MYYVLAFLAGAVVMDLMWAFKLGIPQRLYSRWKHRNDPVVDHDYDRDFV